MSDCCFGNARYTGRADKPAPKRVYGEVKYVPVPDKILTAREYREKLRRNRQNKGEFYLP